MDKTRIIIVDGVEDYDAMLFEQQHKITQELWKDIHSGKTVVG